MSLLSFLFPASRIWAWKLQWDLGVWKTQQQPESFQGLRVGIKYTDNMNPSLHPQFLLAFQSSQAKLIPTALLDFLIQPEALLGL